MDIVCILEHTGDRSHNINQVITLVKNSVHFGASPREIALKAKLDHILNRLGVWLVTNLEHVILCNLLIEACRSCLQIVEGVPHITLRREDQSFHASLFTIERLLYDDVLKTP